MTLLSPLALVALGALALPLLIHLMRRPDRQRIEFAALRWLREIPLPRREWRWHERVLLLLRLALIAAVVLLMAQPAWRGADEPPGPGWVVVAPGLGIDAARGSGVADAASLHWLTPGFPAAAAAAAGSAPPPSAARSDLASLVRQLDADLPLATPLTILLPHEVGGLDAERLHLRRAVIWRIVGADAPPPSAAAMEPPHLRIAIRAAAQGSKESAVARVVVAAWQAAPRSGWQIDLDDATGAVASDTRLLFWLGGADPAALDSWLDSGGTALASARDCPNGEAVLRDAAGEPLLRLQPQGRGRLLCLATALTLEATPALRDARFPPRLFDAMAASIDRPAPDRAFAAAISPLQLEGVSALPTPRSIDAIWGIVVAALFAAERWWATRRRVAT